MICVWWQLGILLLLRLHQFCKQYLFQYQLLDQESVRNLFLRKPQLRLIIIIKYTMGYYKQNNRHQNQSPLSYRTGQRQEQTGLGMFSQSFPFVCMVDYLVESRGRNDSQLIGDSMGVAGLLSQLFIIIITIILIINHHMPPKKKQDKLQQQILWGRPANTLRMGIVGLPNVGKSTTYNLLSNLNVPAENYPFCTIEPNKAVVPVPDQRFKKLCDMFKPKSEVSAVLQVVDIAGIVKGAAEGQGLGNHFLSNIKETDGFYHVVRAFQDEQIAHTENSVDPVRDMEIITTQLVKKDLQFVSNRLQDLQKVIKRTNPKEAREQKEILDKAQALLLKNKWVRHGQWKNEEIGILNNHRFITAKSVIYLINLSSEDFVSKKNKWLKKIKDWIDANVPGEIIPYSADFEKKEAENKDEKKRSMIPKIIKSGYNALDLIYFFTSGTDEVRCWTIRKLTKAPQAAGVIHTDFEKGFICAQIMKYDDLMQLGNEQVVKAQGKYIQKGKQYVIQDGDIIFFRFNVGKGK